MSTPEIPTPVVTCPPSSTQLVTPSFVGAAAGAIIGALVSFAAKKGFNITSETAVFLTQILTTFLTFLGYSLGRLGAASQSNPTNVASTKAAIVTTPLPSTPQA